jgi:predicted transcriptional regulator
MTTITVEIDKDQDVSAVEAALSKLGVRYHVDADDDWGDLSEAEIEGIKAGLADSEAGRVRSHEYVMNYINEKMQKLIAGKK